MKDYKSRSYVNKKIVEQTQERAYRAIVTLGIEGSGCGEKPLSSRQQEAAIMTQSEWAKVHKQIRKAEPWGGGDLIIDKGRS